MTLTQLGKNFIKPYTKKFDIIIIDEINEMTELQKTMDHLITGGNVGDYKHLPFGEDKKRLIHFDRKQLQ